MSYQTRARRSRGRKVGIALLILFVVLVGLVIALDRIGVRVAEDRIAKQAYEEIQRNGASAATQPTVTIGGFPFLTQVLGGKYERITIEAERPKSNNVQLERMTLVATDVTANASDLINGRGPVVAGRISGTATLSWATVKSLIQIRGLPVPFDPAQLSIKVNNDNVELRLPITVTGFSTTLRASGTVQIAGGEVRLKLVDVGTEGAALPAAARAVVNGYRNVLQATIPIPQMPYKLVLQTVRTDAGGVQITATSDNIKLVP